MSEEEELKKAGENTAKLFPKLNELTGMINRHGKGSLTRKILLKKLFQMLAELKRHPEKDTKELADAYIQELINIASTGKDE